MNKGLEIGTEYDNDGNYIGLIPLPPKVREGRPDLYFERDLDKQGKPRVRDGREFDV